MIRALMERMESQFSVVQYFRVTLFYSPWELWEAVTGIYARNRGSSNCTRIR